MLGTTLLPCPDSFLRPATLLIHSNTQLHTNQHYYFFTPNSEVELQWNLDLSFFKGVDHSLIKCRGRLCYIQVNPRKRVHSGIKVYKICESASAYYLGFSIYTRKKPDQGKTHGLLSSEAIVIELLEPYLQHWHTVFMDNWYTSPSPFLELGGKQQMQ
jgi:hypothetical protein